LAENDKLCKVMANMVSAHTDNIPLLARGQLLSTTYLTRKHDLIQLYIPLGFKESRKYLPDAVITDFLDRAIRNRISLRLMAEQHLSLSAASLPSLRPSNASSQPPKPAPPSSAAPTRLGVLDLALSPHELVSTCAEYATLLCDSTYGVSPPYRIEGADPSLKVGFIGTHLEYILTELLKNAFRATVENNVPKKEEADEGVFKFEDTPHAHLLKEDFPPIVVTIGSVPGALTIRVRDQGGGVRESKSAFLAQLCAFRTYSFCRSSLCSSRKRSIRLLLRFHLGSTST
jgi:signal transduction histidine kinase